MSDLSDEVKQAWMQAKGEAPSKLVITDADIELAPGFTAMRDYYIDQTLVQIRRSYRHFAGSNMPFAADELIVLTMPVVSPRLVQLLARVFTDGVIIGQNSDIQVRMSRHFHALDDLFTDRLFRSKSDTMAKGFLADTDVYEFLVDYVSQSVDMVSHLSGFAHLTEVDPNKIWDVWLLVASATNTSAYTSGHTLGVTWAERDTLDGIVIASGEGGAHGSEGEAGSGS